MADRNSFISSGALQYGLTSKEINSALKEAGFQQLNKTEALRLEGSFSDAVRGLAVYGRKALRTKGIAGLLYEIA